MRRWAEAYPTAMKGVLTMREPSKWRSLMFESLKTLAPMGDIIFAPDVPKSGILNVINETTKEEVGVKLNKKEEESLLQLHLMVEEACLIVRTKNKTTGRVMYGLPPEHARKVHDDRAYTLVMAALYIRQLQEKGVLGEPKELDFSSLCTGERKTEKAFDYNSPSSGWLKGGSTFKSKSPFVGISPFSKN